MATKLALRNTTNNGILDTGDGILYDMVTTFGSSSDTGVVNTVGSGTEIQWTKTAGGSTIAWISGRAPSGGFTLTTTDVDAWCHESNGQANCGGRFRVFKRTAAGSLSEVAGGPFNDGVEFGTSAASMTWAGNVTDTAFAEDDRILVRFYITNVGTMGSGRTCTLTFNAANAATGDSFFNIAETVTFKAEEISSTASLTTAGLSAAATATEMFSGTVALTTAGLNAAATATESIPSTAALTTAGLSVAAAANHEEGAGVSFTASLTTAGLDAAGTVTESVPSTAVLTTAGLNAAATASESIPSTAALTTAGLDAAATATESIPATAALALGGLSAGVTATESIPSTAGLTTAGLSVAAGIDVGAITTTASLTTAGLNASATASESYAAAVEVLLAGLSADADVDVLMPVTGTVALALAGLGVSADVYVGVPITGTAELVLAGLSCAGVAATEVSEPEPAARAIPEALRPRLYRRDDHPTRQRLK